MCDLSCTDVMRFKTNETLDSSQKIVSLSMIRSTVYPRTVESFNAIENPDISDSSECKYSFFFLPVYVKSCQHKFAQVFTPLCRHMYICTIDNLYDTIDPTDLVSA